MEKVGKIKQLIRLKTFFMLSVANIGNSTIYIIFLGTVQWKQQFLFFSTFVSHLILSRCEN